MIIAACSTEPKENAGSNPKQAAVLTVANGQAIFEQNCASCHHLTGDATGPALQGAPARWDNDTARLKIFIRHWGEVTASGKDPRAKELAAKWGTMMTSFPNLTDAELDVLLEYIK